MDSPAQEIAERRAFVELRDRAYRLLARREHSRWELRQKLKSRDEAGLMDQVIESLIDEGSLSDDRFAEMLTRSKVSAGKGPRLIEQELRRHQLDDELISTVLSEYGDRWHELAEVVRHKKFGDSPPTDYREWTKQARFLQQRGFSNHHIGSYEGS